MRLLTVRIREAHTEVRRIQSSRLYQSTDVPHGRLGIHVGVNVKPVDLLACGEALAVQVNRFGIQQVVL